MKIRCIKPRFCLPGDTYFRLEVIAEAPRSLTGKRKVICRCACGSQKDYLVCNLRSGYTRSCGCHRVEVSSNLNASHRRSTDRIYKLWSGMLVRARGKASFHSYANRGIGVCERWKKFENFLADMGDRPSPSMTIERLDNDKDYSPENCVWADRTTQARNRRNTVYVTFKGQRRKLIELAEEFGVEPKRLYVVLRRGKDLQHYLEQLP